MHSTYSDVQIAPFVPVLVALLIATVTSPAGVSGAFLLLPFQMSVLHFTSPVVSPTNLIYNLIATPGAVVRFWKEGRIAWPLIGIMTAGTLPGVIWGAWIRITYLPDPRLFKFVTGWVLLYLAGRLLPNLMRKSSELKPGRNAVSHAVNQTRLVNLFSAEIGFLDLHYGVNPVILGVVALVLSEDLLLELMQFRGKSDKISLWCAKGESDFQT